MKKAVLTAISLLMVLGCFGCHQTTMSETTMSVLTTTEPSKEETRETLQTETTTIALEPVTIDASWARKTEPVTLTINDGDRAWGEDEISRHIMNLTGVKLMLQPAYKEPEVLLASGETTDLMVAYMEKDINLLTDETVSQPLDSLSKEFCPDFWDSLDMIEILNNQAADGHVYSLRKGYVSEKAYDEPGIPVQVPSYMMLRTDMLTRIGADLPTSVEELESLLYLAKDQETELGQTITLRLGDVTQSPVTGYMGIRQNVFWDENRSLVRLPYRQEEWLDYLKMMNRWYQDGVLVLADNPYPWRKGQNSLSVDAENPSGQSYYRSMVTHMIDTENKWFCMAESGVNMAYDLDQLTRSNFDSEYPMIILSDVLTYEGEVQLRNQDISLVDTENGLREDGGGALFISKTCANPERAILFMQFLNSDMGAKLTKWGIEDIHYTEKDDGTVSLKEKYQNQDMISYSYVANNQYSTGIGLWSYVDNGTVNGRTHASNELWYTNADLIKLRAMQIEVGIQYKAYTERNPALGRALREIQEKYDAIGDLWQKRVNVLVTSKTASQVEEGWRNLMDELENMDIDQLEAELTTLYKQQLALYQENGCLKEIVIEDRK